MNKLHTENNGEFLPFESLRSLLREGMTTIVMPHLNPDGDAIGSSIALADLLESYGHQVYLVTHDEIPQNLRFLLNRKYYQVDGLLNQGINSFDAAFVVDCGDKTRIQDRESILGFCKKVIVIDHHVTHVHFGDVTIADYQASSTGELIHRLYNYFETPFTPHAMAALYTAMSTDTGSFKYSNTTPYVLRAVADFIENGFDTTDCVTEVYQNRPYVQYSVQYEALQRLVLAADGKVAFSFLDYETLKKNQFSNHDTDGLVELFRDIQGVEVSCFARAVSENAYKLSLRSKGRVDVSQVSLIYGGGGHVRASGCTITGTIDSVKTEIIEVLSKALDA